MVYETLNSVLRANVTLVNTPTGDRVAVFVHLRESEPKSSPGNDGFYEMIPPIANQALHIALTAITHGKTVTATVGDSYVDSEKNESGTPYCYSLTLNS